MKIIGDTTATPMAIPDWNQTDEKKADYIKNKPKVFTEEEVIELINEYGGDDQVQADWEQPNEAASDYIKNKPTLGALASKDEVAKIDLATEVQEAIDKANSSMQSYTETDPTVPAWAKEATKPSYTPEEVGADASGAAASALESAKEYIDSSINRLVTDLTSHADNTNNPHGVNLTQLGVTATATELNYVDGVTSNIQTQLNGKLSDYTIEIYNGTSGNPKPVKFLTVNYATCDSENGVAIKISMVSGHGNGTSYAFLQDAIIKVNYQGGVETDNFKYYGASTGTYDGVNRQYGDIFWVIDTTNKIVDFYVLMGQYARVNSTVYKRLTYSSGGTVTQYKSGTVYSSGDKAWANKSNLNITTVLNRTTNVNQADENYTNLMARGEKLLDKTTADTVTDWEAELVNGAIAWIYE